MASAQPDFQVALLSLGDSAFKVALTLVVVYLAAWPLYALLLHPLRSYPGPYLSAITRIPYWIATIQGGEIRWIIKLHEKYGAVVRYGPNDLSYTDSQAFKDIVGVQKGREENPRAHDFMPRANDGSPSIIQADRTYHSKIRRILSPAFSEKALRSQEPLLQHYSELMVDYARKASTVDMTKLFDFTAFDIMGELTFGTSLGLLESAEYTPWVAAVFNSMRFVPFMQLIRYYPILQNIFAFIEPKSIKAMRSAHFQHSVTHINKRVAEGSEKPDFWNLVAEPDALSLDEMIANGEQFMLGGTETTASLLTGLVYYLIAYPESMKTLTAEIRGKFSRSQDITLQELAGLPYLNACIREGLRIRTPIPVGIPRKIAPGGNCVLGKWLPEGTRVSIPHAATYRSPANFKNPDEFVPERWLCDPEYEDDNRDAMQPFSVGPRNCIGMNLAWHETRLLLAKLLFNFNIESDVGSDWIDQNVYISWDRKPLECRVKGQQSGL